MFATGLAAGILIDATIIRALIVPAVISLMGRWNWWLPTWPARLLRVEPSAAAGGWRPARPRARPAERGRRPAIPRPRPAVNGWAPRYFGRVRRVFIALAAGIALADASIVTLGLPSILVELHATVEGVALVLGVYTAVLALALLPAAWLCRRYGDAHVGAAGLALFFAASIGCGASNSLGLLLALRGIQALGGAGGLVGSFELLDGGRPGTRAADVGGGFGVRDRRRPGPRRGADPGLLLARDLPGPGAARAAGSARRAARPRVASAWPPPTAAIRTAPPAACRSAPRRLWRCSRHP